MMNDETILLDKLTSLSIVDKNEFDELNLIKNQWIKLTNTPKIEDDDDTDTDTDKIKPIDDGDYDDVNILINIHTLNYIYGDVKCCGQIIKNLKNECIPYLIKYIKTNNGINSTTDAKKNKDALFFYIREQKNNNIKNLDILYCILNDINKINKIFNTNWTHIINNLEFSIGDIELEIKKKNIKLAEQIANDLKLKKENELLERQFNNINNNCYRCDISLYNNVNISIYKIENEKDKIVCSICSCSINEWYRRGYNIADIWKY